MVNRECVLLQLPLGAGESPHVSVQHMQGGFIQTAWHRAHRQLKGKCQFLFLPARKKTNTELWYF